MKDKNGFIAYGYGNYGKECSKYFFENNSDVIAFADKNYLLWGGKTEEGYDVISPAEMVTMGYDILIKLCVLQRADTVENELRSAGFTNIEKAKIKLHSGYVKNARKLLYDDLSEKSFDVCVNFWETGDTSGFAEIYTPDIYFLKDIFQFDSDEVYIDVGGYDGNDSEHFIKLTNGSFKHIYIFEPISKMMSVCREKFADNNRVSVLQSALGDEVKDVFFSENGGASRQNKHGSETVRVLVLDKMTIFPPTLIKMDVEGSELEVLNGMKQKIATHKPKLAICLYHKPRDIYEIPLWIAKNFPFYKQYIRQHQANDTLELVLYCVPD